MMTKRLVQSLLLTNLLLISPLLLAKTTDVLRQKDLAKPEVVASFLKYNPSLAANKKDATSFFELALQSKNNNQTGKAFAESAIRYRSPRTVYEYTNLYLKAINEQRKSLSDPQPLIEGGLNYIKSLYLSVLSANDILHE